MNVHITRRDAMKTAAALGATAARRPGLRRDDQPPGG